ncbi:MAG: hypothetical protein E7010_00725 [Alphaproteobacteria bacterium]|nr:hypothetical protein [Alphaproteobacteria bacterium]
MLGDKINFSDISAWKKARVQLDENKEYISPKHIICDNTGNAVGGYYEVVAIDEDTIFQKNKQIAELQTYLNNTDWYILRHAETGAIIPDGVLKDRQLAREKISTLREDK